MNILCLPTLSNVSNGSSSGIGSTSITSSPAAEIVVPDLSASYSARWSTTAPRLVLIKIEFGFIKRNCSRPSRCLVDGLSEQHTITMSLCDNKSDRPTWRHPCSSSNGICRVRVLYRICFGLNAFKRSMILDPIRPAPTKPTTLSLTIPPHMKKWPHPGSHRFLWWIRMRVELVTFFLYKCVW